MVDDGELDLENARPARQRDRNAGPSRRVRHHRRRHGREDEPVVLVAQRTDVFNLAASWLECEMENQPNPARTRRMTSPTGNRLLDVGGS